jgi:hypothetical protein
MISRRSSPPLITIAKSGGGTAISPVGHRTQLPRAARKARRRSGGSAQSARRSQEGAEMSEWQRIGEVPVDSGRLVLVDPMNTDDAAEHEGGLGLDLRARLERPPHRGRVDVLDGLGRRAYGVAIPGTSRCRAHTRTNWHRRASAPRELFERRVPAQPGQDPRRQADVPLVRPEAGHHRRSRQARRRPRARDLVPSCWPCNLRRGASLGGQVAKLNRERQRRNPR